MDGRERRRICGGGSSVSVWRAVWVGGEQAGGSHLRACAARVAGAAAAVMFIACERNGTARSVGDTIGEARRQRVGGDDTDTSLAAEGWRRNISPSTAIDRARRDTGAGNSPDGRTCWDTHRVHPLTRTVESRDVRVGRGGAEARASSAFLFSASAFSSSGAQTLNPHERGMPPFGLILIGIKISIFA